MRIASIVLVSLGGWVGLVFCALAKAQSTAAPALPRPDHIVIVVMENRSYTQIIDGRDTPYIKSLLPQSANFSKAFAVTHPSQPNYLALFSGDTQGVIDDRCPIDFVGIPNLASQLIVAGLSFTGYSEDLPAAGYKGCSANGYRRKHNPWVDFDNVPAGANQSFDAFTADFARLPTVAIVVPNQCHDMHDCDASVGDAWLKANIDAYARWAVKHNSLLIVTFDEDDDSQSNRIPTLIFGAHVRPGTYAHESGHYRLLATIESMYALPRLGEAAKVEPIDDIWQPQ
jgi:phosphatidylinositol-3-phosphatase